MEPMDEIRLNAALLSKYAEASILVCVRPCNQHIIHFIFVIILTPSFPRGIVVKGLIEFERGEVVG